MNKLENKIFAIELSSYIRPEIKETKPIKSYWMAKTI